MTTFLLIRHGDTDAVGKTIMGWKPGWHLNARGKAQVERLASRLARVPIRAIYSSPLERAVETASMIAAPHGLQPKTMDDLGEVRMGEWEGLEFSEIQHRDEFRRFNRFRSGTPAPGGELASEVQNRMARRIDCLRAEHRDDVVAVVSHGDPLRSALAYYMGIPLDLMFRFEVSTASVSVLEMSDWGARVLRLNDTGELPVESH